jgi:uncharacterized protein YndB with AHSA1/START domain
MTNPTHLTAPAGQPFVDVERRIDAPLSDVWRAYTEPELVKQWLGPRGYEMEVDSYDVRDGGQYHYVHIDPEGNRWEFRGVFHSIRPEESMVQTFEFAGAPGHVSLDAATFEAVGDATIVRLHSVFQTQEARDAMVSSGMQRGVTDGFDQLEELVSAR